MSFAVDQMKLEILLFMIGSQTNPKHFVLLKYLLNHRALTLGHSVFATVQPKIVGYYLVSVLNWGPRHILLNVCTRKRPK
jgi:uncharacterized membrane protein YbjE (DUF340 family)